MLTGRPSRGLYRTHWLKHQGLIALHGVAQLSQYHIHMLFLNHWHIIFLRPYRGLHRPFQYIGPGGRWQGGKGKAIQSFLRFFHEGTHIEIHRRKTKQI